MILWRISNYQVLDGAGGLYVSGRWHTKGHPVIYCTWNPSTALLETLVHMEIDVEDRPEHFQVLKIEGPDTLSIERIDADTLPSTWAQDTSLTQSLGDSWLSAKHSLLLEVPSALVPETANILINTLHEEAGLLKIIRIYEHAFDTRFF